MTIGILSIQGSFAEHHRMLRHLGVATREIRTPMDMAHVHGVVLPGGESTTMTRLLEETGLDKALAMAIMHGMPTFATCAGTILLAKNIESGMQLLDIDVTRNAYGRQQASFDVELTHVDASLQADTVRGVFIRAPKITRTGDNVTTLVSHEEHPVLVQENHILAATFHPELTRQYTIHQYFLERMVLPHHT